MELSQFAAALVLKGCPVRLKPSCGSIFCAQGRGFGVAYYYVKEFFHITHW